MATLVTPTGFVKERWMRVSVGGDLFVFSGIAKFGDSSDPIGSMPIQGEGDNDSGEQRNFVKYEVTDMLVGPHWRAVREVCPAVVVGGLHQHAPDEADGMGYEVTRIKKINVVDLGGFSRIELQVNVEIAGGLNGRILSLAYKVTAFGQLHSDVGNEGVFFSQQ